MNIERIFFSKSPMVTDKMADKAKNVVSTGKISE
jgi:hypothetical protein